MRRGTPFATVAFVAVAVVCAVTTAGLSGSARTVALAICGTGLVIVTEVAFRFAHRRRWTRGAADGTGTLPAWRDVSPVVALSVLGGVGGWLTVEAASAASARSFVVLAAGGVAAVLAILAAVAAATGPRSGNAGASSRGRRAPLLRGRRSGRGTRPSPPDPSVRRAPSS
jgi:hypothetical protein